MSRFVTITRVDSGKKVIVAPQLNEILDGARVPITMDGKFDSITLVTDGAMNIAPDLEGKAEIILNAVYVANALDAEAS